MSSILDIQNVSFAYENELVLKDVSLTVEANDFIGIIGPNGGGKTTLLRLILGVEKPKQGTIQFCNQSSGNPVIGYLPQYNKVDNNFPICVFDVVRHGFLSGQKAYKRFSAQENKLSEEVLEKVGMLQMKKRPIGELSGGQKQRVFLARAIVNHPQLLILDEPNTYVDNQFENDLYKMLTELNNEMAILLVSHDLGTISSHVKSIACVNRELQHHRSNKITPEQLKHYNCPIQLISHGDIPHTILKRHKH